MRLSDENTREGRHLTPEERIALQAEEIKQLQQENEQLQAQLDEWKYEAKCHMDEVIARDKEIGKLRAQVARMWEALRKAREAIQRAKENFEPYGEYEYDVRYDLEEALAAIDKAIGGKEDVTSMGD